MKLNGILLAGLCALGPAVVHAQSAEALAWLRKIHDATQNLSYRGTFVYQNGGRSETSRITRYVEGSSYIEKLEVMDGVPREILRTKDTVRCYLPGSRLVNASASSSLRVAVVSATPNARAISVGRNSCRPG